MRVAAAIACLGLASVASTQVAWSRFERTGHAVAENPVTRTLVLFGGTQGSRVLGDTWEGTGGSWSQRYPDTSPPPRSGHALAFHSSGDSAATSMILFGGTTKSGISNETWVFNGTRWSLGRTPTLPPPRSDHAMVFDSARLRIVMFGGSGSFRNLDDTWEYDGVWKLRTPSTKPEARWGHALAYDPVRGTVVVFGGNGSRSDTWEFDSKGNAWKKHVTPPANTPPGRFRAAAVWDDANNQVVLFGGRGASGLLGDTWVLDIGRTGGWIDKKPATSPPARTGHALAYDRRARRVVLVGGEDGSGNLFTDRWEWDGTRWIQASTPIRRSSAPMVYDAKRKQSFLFGGLGLNRTALRDTWVRDGAWQQLFLTQQPAARWAHGLAYDAARERVVLFGGSERASQRNDTWLWNGTAWSSPAVAAPPVKRAGPGMAYDAKRERVVLFGGWDSTNSKNLDDTWEWDGVTWKQARPATGPKGRHDTSLAYDPVRQKVILFGGWDGTVFRDMWEWDGAAWKEIKPSVLPPARMQHAMSTDTARDRVVLFGGLDPLRSVRLNDVWEWDGVRWALRTPAVGPTARSAMALSFDAERGETILFGGDIAAAKPIAETWIYHPTDPAGFDVIGTGCRGSAGVPLLARVEGTGPWLGSIYAVEVGKVPAAAFGAMFLGVPLEPPLKLDPLGMTGCELHTIAITTTAFVASSGRARWLAPIPNAAALLSVVFRNQALVLDRPANSFGATMSNAGDATVGRK